MYESSLVVTRSAGSLLRRFVGRVEGATSIEYAVIASGLALVIVAGIDAVGIALNDVFVEVEGLF